MCMMTKEGKEGIDGRPAARRADAHLKNLNVYLLVLHTLATRYTLST